MPAIKTTRQANTNNAFTNGDLSSMDILCYIPKEKLDHFTTSYK